MSYYPEEKEPEHLFGKHEGKFDTFCLLVIIGALLFMAWQVIRIT